MEGVPLPYDGRGEQFTGRAAVDGKGRRLLSPAFRPAVLVGSQVLDRLRLGGGETVMDAGCGTGRLTASLLERLPRGRVCRPLNKPERKTLSPSQDFYILLTNAAPPLRR